jgi:hypothetical protein
MINSGSLQMDTNNITAICTLSVSLVATIFALWLALGQRRHMRLSVRPFAAFTVADFEDGVGVFLANNRLGPMRIRNFVAERSDGKTHSDLVSHMPPLRHGVRGEIDTISLKFIF